MKIRTDFVTNSSSSSFVVEIAVVDTDRKTYRTEITPDVDGWGARRGETDLKCMPEEIIKSSSLESLLGLIKKSIYCEDEKRKYNRTFKAFKDSVENSINELSEIDKIEFRRIWHGNGETEYLFVSNMDNDAEELRNLACRVCSSEGKEKEEALLALSDYLKTLQIDIESNGGRFMGGSSMFSLEWSRVANSLESFAHCIAENMLTDEGYAEETTIIDFRTRDVSQKALYYLTGVKPIDDGTFVYKAGKLIEFKVPKGNKNINITIPNGITSIGDDVFSEIDGLVSVTISEGVERIEDNNFSFCDKLESVKMPNRMKYIGKHVFDECKQLKEIVIPEGIEEVSEIGDFMDSNGFSDSARTKSALISLSLPNSIKRIDRSFIGGKYESLVIPEGVEAIEGDWYERPSFGHSINLVDVSFPNSLKILEGFTSCRKLKSVIIPDSVERINAFSDCPRLATVKLSNSLKNIEHSFNYTAIKDVDIPNCTEIVSWSFNECHKIQKVVIPGSVRTISNSFTECEYLHTIVLLEGVQAINVGSFSKCPNLNDLYLPSSLTDIGEGTIPLRSRKGKVIHTIEGCFVDEFAKQHNYQIRYDYDEYISKVANKGL